MQNQYEAGTGSFTLFVMILLSSHLFNVSFSWQHCLQLTEVVQQSVLHFLSIMFPVLLLHLMLKGKESR